jgi:hypothetical protein
MLLILFTFLNRKAQSLLYILFFAGALGFFLQVLYWAVVKNDFFLLFMSSLLALLCIFLAANLGNALRRD